MMPSDLGQPSGDFHRPVLCADCSSSIASLRQKDHVTDRESDRVAVQLARQCGACYRLREAK